MAVYDVFGFLSNDLEQVRAALEKSLGIHFEPHESSFRGEYYLYENPRTNEELSLESNVDPEEGGPLYLEFSEFPIVLYVNDTKQHDKLTALLQSAITGCKLIKHEDIP